MIWDIGADDMDMIWDDMDMIWELKKTSELSLIALISLKSLISLIGNRNFPSSVKTTLK